jgi:hypothetical protein
MSQPPIPGPGPGEEPVPGSRLPTGPDGTAGAPAPTPTAAPAPSPTPPPTPTPTVGAAGRDAGGSLRLEDFTEGGAGDAWLPGPELAVVLDRLCGPDQRCPGADDDELIGLLGRWAALEAWAAAAKLGVVRELIRRRPDHARWHDGQAPGELPQRWDQGTGHEVAGALKLSLPAADKVIDLAWALRARLPGIAAALADGSIDYVKTVIIVKELAVLDDEHAALAEALILAELAGKTAGQVGKLAAAAAATVDPEGTEKRREHAEREDARVRLWRESSGACTLAGHGLPTDAALAADANIQARARQYKRAKIQPDARMDQLRVLAFCDILNGITAADRIAQARAAQAEGEAEAEADPGGPAADDGRASGTEPDDDGTGTGRGEPPAREPGGDTGPALPAAANLTFPLATLQKLAERPGDAYGFGPLDPALARDLAAAAARSPHSRWCITITDSNGYAIGHGCARPARTAAAKSRDSPWTLRLRHGPGPPDGYGSWTLTLPGGQELIVNLRPVPVTDCDHRFESHSYQPSDTLRHLVEIRDGTCTFPSCSRHARNCDFEHTVPHDRGGRTCACNGSARSRRCHRVKQSKGGWTVTQPRPGWHQWTTPSGRTYTQGPMKYPA